MMTTIEKMNTPNNNPTVRMTIFQSLKSPAHLLMKFPNFRKELFSDIKRKDRTKVAIKTYQIIPRFSKTWSIVLLLRDDMRKSKTYPMAIDKAISTRLRIHFPPDL
jgi:hypothetical protein